MSRGWTWIDEDAERTEEQIELVTPLLDQLARQWSELHDAEERRGWARRQDIEEGYGGYERDDMDEADTFRFDQLEQLRQRQLEDQMSAILDLMEAHGARMMRPYEHWNEDEAYVAYMERDRD